VTAIDGKGQAMNVLDNAFGLHAKTLGLRSQRMELLARNIANADTPNFKAQDIDFKQVMQQTQQTAMVTTQAGHIAQGDAGDASGVKYRTPFNTSFDGNTVELNVEQSNYGKSAADYQATLSFLEQRVSGIRKALRGD
jgi:flagellar basal-body rod protein FlgB